MFLCSEGHEEVCHEGRKCPACELKEDIRALENEVYQLKIELEELAE